MSMKHRVIAAQKLFWIVIGANLVILVLAVPASNDAKYLDSLKELSSFQSQFDLDEQRKYLVSQVQNKTEIPLTTLAQLTDGPGVKQVSANSKRVRIANIQELDLGTLAKIDKLSRHDAKLKMQGPVVKQIGESLRWRLARDGSDKGYHIDSVTWEVADVDREAYELERKVESSRQAALVERREYLRAVKKRDIYDKRLKSMRKYRASRKHIRKARIKYIESKKGVFEHRTRLDEARARYKMLASQVEKIIYKKQDKNNKGVQTAVVVNVLIRCEAGNRMLKYNFPVMAKNWTVAIRPLSSNGFKATRQAGLWHSIENKPIGRAIETVERKFSWHNKKIGLLKASFSGSAFLQVLPLFIAGINILLAFYCRKPKNFYNPFKPEKEGLKKVGFGNSYLDCITLVGLSFVIIILTCISLFRIDVLPILTILFGTAAIGTAVWCCYELINLNELSEEIRRTSMPPRT